MRLVFFHSYDCAIIEWCVARPAKSPTPTFTPVRGVESISLGRPEARSRRMAIRVPRLVVGERVAECRRLQQMRPARAIPRRKLIERYGRDGKLVDWKDQILADCPRRANVRVVFRSC